MAPAAVISLSGGRGAGPALRLLGDRHLGRLASKGDARAFAAIYERHHQDLYRYCRSITGNAEDASDALQNTMAAALRSLPGERREIALRPWLFKVAHNESLSLIRRRRPASELNEEAASAAPGPYGLACMRERVTVLVENLRDLPERQRGAIVMRELNGLDYDDIAIALGVSSAAARQAVYEARVALTELEEGREMECDAVRRSISARDGRMLRGRRLRAHLRGCRSCTNFSEQVDVRSSALSSIFPPLPAAAGAGILASLLGAGGAGGGGAAVGAAAGAGSGGVLSIFTGGVSGAAGASGAAKSAAAVVAVAVAGVGGVEVAQKAATDPPPSTDSAVTAPTRPGHSATASAKVRALARAGTRRRRAAAPAGPAPASQRGSAGRAGGQEVEHVSSPLRSRRRKLSAPVVERVSAPPAVDPVQAPVPVPRAPTPSAPAAQPSTPAMPEPWRQQYEDGMARYQAGMNLVQETMQGVQQMMNGLFSGSRR